MHFISVDGVHPYNNSMEASTAWKKSRFILSDRSDFHMINNLSIAEHIFARCILKRKSITPNRIARIGYVEKEMIRLFTIRGSLNQFPDFFRMGPFIDSTHSKLESPSK